MPGIHIVTDSCANFPNPHFLQQNPVTVVPATLTIKGKQYRDGIDLKPEEALALIAGDRRASITPPSINDYAAVYARLAPTTDLIISLHASRELLGSWENAQTAAQQVMGNSGIAVVDSRTICAAQGMLVGAALRASQEESSTEEIVRRIRGAIERIYAVYYVESVDHLMHNDILSSSHTMLGAMLGIKPFLTIEDGEIKPIEKVRTRAQAVERLVEFAVEFTDIEDALILHHRPKSGEQARMLQDRLAQEFPDQHFAMATYNPALACLIGADAAGVVIMEEELDHSYDGI